MNHHRTDAHTTQTYRHASTRAGLVAAALAGALVVPALGASAAAAPGAEPGTPDRPVAALTAAYAYVDTNRDGGVDKIVLVDPSTMGAHPSTSSSAPSTASRSSVSPQVTKLNKQLAAAKVAAAKAATANVKAQRVAATLARTAKVAAATARTARQRAYARQLAKKAAVAARVATVANAKSKAAASLVKSLKKAIDRINRVGTPAPTSNTPTPTTNTPAPAPTAPATVSSASCDTLAPTFRPVPVTSNWQVSCVDSFPGVTIEPGYTVLGLTRYDSGQGLAQVMVLRSQSANQLPATFAHELAHAYSITSMTYPQRSVFLNRIRTSGLTTAADFFSQSVSYDTMPAEIWARTQASCVGYPAPFSTFTEATCTDVQAAIKG